jgi:uncharacterized damage-inducible protein DinB
MIWTAPEVQREAWLFSADERTSLQFFLDRHRATLLWKCQGLTGEQLTTRSIESSVLSLLGLVRHMAEVERSWFRQRFAGQADLTDLYSSEEFPDGDFDLADGAGAEADFATFAAECAAADQAVRDRSLDDTFHDPHPDEQIKLRWVYLHMIEEYARHNGHADILREQIDGVTGH